MARPATLSQQELLFNDSMREIARLTDNVRSGTMTPQQFQAGLTNVVSASESLDAARKGRLALRAQRAFTEISAAAARGGPLALRPAVPAQVAGRFRAGQLQGAQGQARFQAGEAERAQRAGGGPLALRPTGPSIQEQLRQSGRLQVEQQAQGQANVARRLRGLESRRGLEGQRLRATAIPKALFGEQQLRPTLSQEALLGAVETSRTQPGLLKASAAAERSIGESVTRGQRARRGGLAAAGGGLLALLASKIFGGKANEGIDPATQLLLAQQLGGGAAGGQRSGISQSSRTLIDVSRLLTILKGLQDVAGLQGPAQTRPRLI